MADEPVKIILDANWQERVDRAVEAAGRLADGVQRIAKALEKLAELKRQEYL